MKTLIRLLVMALAVASVAACAPATTTTRADADDVLTCDTAQMDRVEKDARRTFKEVHWLRCPPAPAARM
jgi:hypothetical protein